MARVHAGFDELLHVDRAIKVLNPNLMRSNTIRERFLNEARTMAKLSHPNLVSVVDVGVDTSTTPGTAFLVMELMDGALQDRLVRDGPMPPYEACELLLGMLAGLGHAHERGVIHRDIKPHNVLMASDGTPKVADFGIARMEESKGLTRTGSTMGTAGFMAPEQRISAKEVDHRADLYAVGTSLFSMVTGQLPVDLYASELDDSLLIDVPDALRPFIRQSTKYKPAERFADANAMIGALRACMGQLDPDTPALARPVSDTMPSETFDPSSLDGLDPAPRSGPTSVPGHSVSDGGWKAARTSSWGEQTPAAAAGSSPGAVPAAGAAAGMAEVQPDLGRQVPPPPPPVHAPTPPPTSSGTMDTSPVPGSTHLEEPDEPARKRPWLLAVVALLAAGGGAGGFAVWQSSQSPDPVETPETTAQVDEPAPTEPAPTETTEPAPAKRDPEAVAKAPAAADPVVQEPDPDPVVEAPPAEAPVEDAPVAEAPVEDEPVAEEPAAPVTDADAWSDPEPAVAAADPEPAPAEPAEPAGFELSDLNGAWSGVAGENALGMQLQFSPSGNVTGTATWNGEQFKVKGTSTISDQGTGWVKLVLQTDGRDYDLSGTLAHSGTLSGTFQRGSRNLGRFTVKQ